MAQRIDRETAAGTHECVYEVEAYDHRGRAIRARQGDAVRTAAAYDVVTERLLRLQSTAGARSLQDLHFAYDPMGNITQVRDAAQAVLFRDNAELPACNDYRYDALYRLVEATGREHEGQAANGRAPADVIPLRAGAPSDPKAMRRYAQRYRYDAVGNLTCLQHFAGAGSWRREYAYAGDGNRLLATGIAAVAMHERYEHDLAGQIVAMPHLSRLQYDALGQLESVRCGTQQIWLQYAAGARVRKLVLRGEGVVEDRVYLGSEELYTKRRGAAIVEQTLTEHAGGGLQVDVKLVADGKAVDTPVALRRYAIADHLGSTRLEVDGDGRVIAYEEFHPYGTTSYRAMRTGLDAGAKRYRFTGMERDEQTGLAQHGARYYAAWLGRWTAADPIGIGHGVNRYAYCRGSPTTAVDPDGCATERIAACSGALVTTGRGSVGRGPTLLCNEDDEQFAGAGLLARAHAGNARSPEVAFARARAQHLVGAVLLGNARPPGLPENAVPVRNRGFVVGFTAGVAGDAGSGDELQQFFDITGAPTGTPAVRGSAEQDYTIETTIADLLALRGAVGALRSAAALVLERRAALDAIARESAPFSAERGAGLVAGSSPATFADALLTAQTRVAAQNAARLADVEVLAAGGAERGVFSVGPYRPSAAPLESHHGVLDVWASHNIPGYASRGASTPTIALTEAQHAATKAVYRDWLFEQTGRRVGGSVNWNQIGAREMQSLTNRMFDAAGVPAAARTDYFRAFHQYIYGVAP